MECSSLLCLVAMFCNRQALLAEMFLYSCETSDFIQVFLKKKRKEAIPIL